MDDQHLPAQVQPPVNSVLPLTGIFISQDEGSHYNSFKKKTFFTKLAEIFFNILTVKPVKRGYLSLRFIPRGSLKQIEHE